MLSCGVRMLSCVINVIMLDELLSCGMKCYHVGSNVIMWDEMLSCGMNEMLSSGIKRIM
jgi:hypothetical protein